ncbi:transglutaminaseTgpA domain-containing protein [Helicobacter bizzozeronii]|uniref:transglutaminaseTgpA domain-containing protein n=1 Tax=Helicobacter bizzozeronii TaxID=56877 RepID=UPI000CEEAB8F|nr:transglutaminaseTgpA domain-containing protein [Helicobacter bizzozeronii]
MKILALIFCPFVFFALRQQLGKALVAFVGPTYVASACAFWLSTLAGHVTALIFVFIVYLVTIIWVSQSNEYESSNKLPKHTFISVFFPFATLFAYKRTALGVIALINFLIFITTWKDQFLLSMYKPNDFKLFVYLFVFLGVFDALYYYSVLFSLMKCVSTSLETQETQEQVPTPSPTAPSQRASRKPPHANLAKLLTLPNDQLIEFLKDKTPKEIATIQTSLEDLPIKQQIPIKKAIKEVLGELENI